jgi:hypothetical protein
MGNQKNNTYRSYQAKLCYDRATDEGFYGQHIYILCNASSLRRVFHVGLPGS